MDYHKAKANPFATGIIPDGYYGNFAEVGFHFDKQSGKTVCVALCGCFLFGIPPAIDANEALWLIKNHPTSNARQVVAL